ncbi:MAG: TonB-dependent receptor [Acidobacteria bacterium]|nr:TonB-dependent receptor [Acidobacteriota bacterium]
MRMRKYTRRIVEVVCLCMFSWATAGAQGTTASILGTIYDQSQAVLPGVTVVATDRDTGQRREAITDERGRFSMAQMKIGRYRVEAELPGFQTAGRDVTLTLEGDAVVNFTLLVGAAETEVMVTSEAPLVETASSSVKGLVDQQQIRDLPLNGRSFADLAAIQTGVLVNYNQNSTSGNEGTKLNIAGTRSTQTSFQLDGTEIRNQMGTTPGSLAGVLLGVDTVQEFSVITGVANAEYGAFTGGVVSAVTRSGTNSLHGTVFEFLRNSALDARNFFDRNPSNPGVRSDPPPFKRNQYGFTLGGPIRKDSLFFFGSFEGLNDRLTTTQTGFVPSLNARQGIFSTGNVTPSPITKPLIDSYPLPNGRLLGVGDVAEYIFVNPRVVDEQYYVAKIDWQVSPSDSIAGRYTFDDATRDILGNLGLMLEKSKTRAQFLMLEWKKIISARLINEARVSLNRPSDFQDPLFFKPFPAVMLFNPLSTTFEGKPRYGEIGGGGVTTLGYSMRSGRRGVLNRFQYIENLSYTTGAHSFKAGLNIHRIQYNYVQPAFVAGQYTFRTVRDFVAANTPQTFLGTITGVIPRGVRQILMGFYVQDDWRIRPNLTFNMGLRYEPFTRPNEVAGRISALRRPSDTVMTVGNPMFTVNPSLQNFAPRVGFAWDPFGNGKTSVRAGYGLFFELVQPVHYFNTSTFNAPFAIRILRDNPPFPNPRQDLPDDPRLIQSSPQVISDEIRQGGLHQYQFSIQRELLPDIVVQVAYTGSHGYNLGHIVDRNTAIPQRDAAGVYPFWPAGSTRRNPAFSQLRDLAWDASSFYNALGLTVRKRFSQGYSFQLSYNYGKSIDDHSSTSVFDTGGSPNGSSLFPDDVTFDRGLSGFDVRNRLVLSGSWNLPFGSGRAMGGSWSGPVEQILGGWTLNGILTAAGGNRGNLLMPVNRSRSGQTTDIADRPNLIPGGNNNPILSGGRDPNAYFDVFQFEPGPLGYFGNLARNTIENPGVLTADFSIGKSFNFREDRYLQFRAEMFNIANRANFGGIGAAFSGAVSPFLGGAALPRNPTAARITRTITTSRQIQFGLKLYF